MSFWIYADEMPQATHFYYFTKKFNAEAGDTLTANVCADTRYQLFINDRMVCEGPCQGPERQRFYESEDLTPYIVSGENTILVKVLFVCGNSFTTAYRRQQPALWFDGLLTHNGEATQFSSDESWECARDDSALFHHCMGLHTSMPPFEEALEEKKLTCVPVKKWYEPALARNSVSPYGIYEAFPLVKRSIPQMMEHPARTMTELCRRDGEIEYDSGEYTTAKVYFTFKAPRGSVIKITYAESYCYDDAKGFRGKLKKIRDDYADPESYILGAYDIIHATGEEQTFSPFWYRAFRFIKIEFPKDADCRIDAPVYRSYFYPLTSEGSFECSEKSYNDMWHVSLNTLLCCTHEMYVDCPYYEQGQYCMDATLEMLYTFRYTSDARMPLKSLLDLGASQRPDGMICANYPAMNIQVIPGFSLFWVLMAREYLRYTGDLTSVRKLLGIIDKIFEAFENLKNGDGLIGPGSYWQFVDWVPAWPYGVPVGGNSAPMTVTCLTYATALRAAGEICEALGKTSRANEYSQRANEMIYTVNKLCFDENVGLYRDVQGKDYYSQHSTVWAVLSGAVKGEDAGRLIDRTFELDDKVFKCTFSMNHYFFRALELADRYNYAPKLFEGWQKMLDLHCTTWCENPDSPRSECHAWSSAPTYELSEMVLGVYPSGNGYDTIRVRPSVSGLGITWARGVVPTVKGDVSVDWRIEDRDFSMNVTVPDGASAVIELPDGSITQMTSRSASFSCKI